MSQPTVPETVHKGDLILAYKPKEAHMLLVVSAPDDTNNTNIIQDASSIMVQRVNWHIPDSPGFWTLYGPEVYYVDKDEEDEKDERFHRWYCLYDDHSKDLEEESLDRFLKSMAVTDADAKDNHTGVALIVNPHGRDVIKHYFHGSCPHCGSTGWFCPGCGGVGTRFPDLFGSCGVDQSCPVCLGYEFALEDKRRIRELDRPEMILYRYKDRGEMSGLCKAQMAKTKAEALELAEERYGLIYDRKVDMGLNVENEKKTLQDWKDSHL
ncbi:hypothetical protein DTO166G4_346 [Paecilomyces variotii]|nr:hypothetical protein DTO166G4_346 [Paecilomyces variotii]KAJ9229669.1 hypothetical protein DTO166G5_7739 [Paecilomyces variotii]KAJ9307011.1 hypothetical protein DTO217A2_3431 [Paecilomyces variotii]KAJ9370965.1 hypothetical protein DTO282E5_4262 [Paecilomyces variotii]KAJ9389490.1 hypothetical protein DTO063F5_1983 [Paecilomyces variotii]